MDLAVVPVIDTSKFIEFPQYNSFNRDKKRLFLEQYALTPNITGIANALGHSRTLVFWHLERDPAFKKAFEDIREGITEGLEAKVAEYGQRPNNFMDRIAWLRARRPEVWNPKPELAGPASIEVTVKLGEAARSYVDTTATPTDKPTP